MTNALVAVVVGVLAPGGGGVAPAAVPAVGQFAQVGAGWQSWQVTAEPRSLGFGPSGFSELSAPAWLLGSRSGDWLRSWSRSSADFASISPLPISPTSDGPCLSPSGPEWDSLPSADTSPSCDPAGSLSVVATEIGRLRAAAVFGFALTLLTLAAALVVSVRR